MKTNKILDKELDNSSEIFLYRQGLFLRAYEKSAMLLLPLKELKIIYKYIETFA
jgi:hypothetical protein